MKSSTKSVIFIENSEDIDQLNKSTDANRNSDSRYLSVKQQRKSRLKKRNTCIINSEPRPKKANGITNDKLCF